MANSTGHPIARYLRGLLPPLLIPLFLAAPLVYALYTLTSIWLKTDENNLREWLDNARPQAKTLPELTREYLRLEPGLERDKKAQELWSQLDAMTLPNRRDQTHLVIFPAVYRIEIKFQDASLPPIEWDSGLPRPADRVRRLTHHLLGKDELGNDDPRAWAEVEYQMHVYDPKQAQMAELRRILLWLVPAAVLAVLAVLVWAVRSFLRERKREIQQLVAERQIEHAEKLLLENELQRRQAEHQREEAERKLLEQRLATQDAEQKTLQLQSQIYAGIGIMAGSYAHNIKNLLVRPNDLISRCLEQNGLAPQQETMLHEVRQTLGTVTERLQQILRTVRRDPAKAERTPFDLNELAREIQRSWQDMAREKWKAQLSLELAPEALPLQADRSHVLQAVENLVFNARDATFELRNHLRDEARSNAQLNKEQRQQALIDAAAWKGQVVVRTLRRGPDIVLEVSDNGAGMSEEVRRRCTETHFTTKRDNALYEGNTTGMGLGLSFVQTVMEHHQGRLEIESAPLAGATIRLVFPA